MLKYIFALSGLLVSAQASEIAYSQNNLPRQNTAQGNLAKDHPFMVNVDILYGKITGQPALFGFKDKKGLDSYKRKPA